MANILEILLRSSGGDQVKADLGKVSGSTSDLDKVFRKLGDYLTVGALVTGIKASIKEFENQERATIKLNSALKNQGVTSQEVGIAFQKQASELMNLTEFTDYAITSAQAYALSMGVAADTVKKITPLVLDFSAATGTDLTQAFFVLGKASLGMFERLKQIGIVVDENEIKTKGFQAVVDKLQASYGGTAKAIKEGVLGPGIQFKQNLGEIGEEIGGVTLPALNKLSKAFNEVFKQFGGSEQNKIINEYLDLQKRAQKILEKGNFTIQERVMWNKRLSDGAIDYARAFVKSHEKEQEINEIKVKNSKEMEAKLAEIREKEQKAKDEQIEKSKDQIEKEYDLRRNLGELDLKSVIENLEERFAQEELGTEKSKALFQALSDYKNALGIDDAARIKEIQDSISSNLETNLGDMLMGQKTWSEATSGIWDNLHRMIIDMILKETIETKAAAVVKIAAEQAVIAAKAMSAYVGIPFVGIALGLGAIAMVANEINKAKTFQSGGIVPGAEGSPVRATVHGGERILTPQQQRRGIGGGVNIGTIEIIFPEITSFSDWMNASPAVIKQVTERKILQALSTLEDEGKVKEGTVLI